MSQRSVSGLTNKRGSFIIRTFSLETQMLLLRSMHWSRLIFPLFTQLVCEKSSFIIDTGTISLEGSSISDPLSYVTWPVGRVLCSANSPKGIMVNNNKNTHFSASHLCKSYRQWKKNSCSVLISWGWGWGRVGERTEWTQAEPNLKWP